MDCQLRNLILPPVAPLNEAILPIYILHQTIIVILGYYLVKWPISIGEKFGLTRERVRQIKDKAINKLRSANRSKLLKGYLGS